jgi:hypothetical protein
MYIYIYFYINIYIYIYIDILPVLIVEPTTTTILWVVTELFYTERAHVRNLKVLQRVFQLPMQRELRESSYVDLTHLLFPNLPQVIAVHSVFAITFFTHLILI